ncbi:transposase [Frankia sp. CNm7]|uniref:DUF4351 domain-containing protein n=1 Tax=Frankia nepalensis TaxID=1836974 RepID=A0A937UQT7_9ACTN|nr:hypothetical protein [Frankia nepalensis]MBL7502022.1 transposase [Frankia nepalensis]MBL7510302.1 transposase [Frankia nepalensis]MBL7517028.1 transposase [Frankia nepalensis]MBL7630433.1 hypothetical protein [Frankia nepalensis]
MTTADVLRAEGEIRGRVEMLMKQLTIRFGPVPQTALDLIHAASIDQLETWATRVLTGPTLQDVLR